MTPSPEHIAQSRQLVRLRALRTDVAARALARARAALADAECAVQEAEASERDAERLHETARAAIARAADMLSLRLDHLRGCAVIQAEAALAAVRAGEARDEAASTVRTAARAFERERARHERFDTDARKLRRTRARLLEERAAEPDGVARRVAL